LDKVSKPVAFAAFRRLSDCSAAKRKAAMGRGPTSATTVAKRYLHGEVDSSSRGALVAGPVKRPIDETSTCSKPSPVAARSRAHPPVFGPTTFLDLRQTDWPCTTPTLPFGSRDRDPKAMTDEDLGWCY